MEPLYVLLTINHEKALTQHHQFIDALTLKESELFDAGFEKSNHPAVDFYMNNGYLGGNTLLHFWSPFYVEYGDRSKTFQCLIPYDEWDNHRVRGITKDLMRMWADDERRKIHEFVGKTISDIETTVNKQKRGKGAIQWQNKHPKKYTSNE